MNKKHLIVLVVVCVLVLAGAVAAYLLTMPNNAQPTTNTLANTNVNTNANRNAATLAYQQGNVQVMLGGNSYTDVDTDTVLHQGDRVRTGAESKAIVELDNGDIIRMSADTEISLVKLSASQISIVQTSGSTYNRVAKGLDRTYAITSGTVLVEALGTAFDLSVTDESLDVLAFEDAVALTTSKEKKDVTEGNKANVKISDEATAIAPIDDAQLKNSWYAWNKSEDTKQNFKGGILAEKDLGEYDDANANSNANVNGSTNANTNTNTTPEQKFSLQASKVDNGIRLTWEVQGITIANGFKVVRGSGENPEFGKDEAVLVSDVNARTYTWEVKDGKTYHFRICQYNGSGCDQYTNDASAQAPETPQAPAITGPNLSVYASETGVGLWWGDRSTIPGFQYYKVVRSETDPEPVYPEDGYIAVRNKGEEHYNDISAIKGKSYYYRICAVGDSVYCGQVQRTTAVHENKAPVANKLTAVREGDSIKLTWTKSSEADFKYYKLVWSMTDSTPRYPENGYIGVFGKDELTLTDDGSVRGTREDAVDLTEGTYYYSVCIVDSQDQVTCSNTITLAEGTVSL